FFQRYSIVPRDGRPIVFGWSDPAGVDDSLDVRKALFWDYFPCGRRVSEGARLWVRDVKAVLQELGVLGERIGIDRLDFIGWESLQGEGIRLADARVPLEKARAVKT